MTGPSVFGSDREEVPKPRFRDRLVARRLPWARFAGDPTSMEGAHFKSVAADDHRNAVRDDRRADSAHPRWHVDTDLGPAYGRCASRGRISYRPNWNDFHTRTARRLRTGSAPWSR